MDKKVTKKEMKNEIVKSLQRLGIKRGEKYHFVPTLCDKVKVISNEKSTIYEDDILWVTHSEIGFSSYVDDVKTAYTECKLTSK
ncbi:MAG: hypothetical protein J6X18_04695 [Bacteroidales bacterium]|nr:hypothetical protein [Bacteroidales bacterium]